MFWNDNVCRLCSQISLPTYYIFEETEGSIEMKLKRYLKLNVHKDDCKPKEVCNSCYIKLEDLSDFLDMCYESNNKFECMLYNDRKSSVQDIWNHRLSELNENEINTKSDENILPPDLSLLVKDNILELEPISSRTLDQNIPTTNFTNIVNLNLDSSNIKPNYNRTVDNYQQNQSVLRHSSEYVTEKLHYVENNNFCNEANFSNEENYVKSINTTRKVKDGEFNDKIADTNTGILINENEDYYEYNNKDNECMYSNRLNYAEPSKNISICEKFVGETINEVSKHKNDDNTCRKPNSLMKTEEIEINAINMSPTCEKTKTDGIKTVESKNEKNTNKKQFFCNYCNKTFMRKENLKSHLSIHTNIRPFKCDICNKSFPLRWDLTCHKRIHTNLYQCKFCKKNFSFQSKLDRHIRTHTNDRPFACNFSGCNKRFSDNRNLITHKLIHSDVKNFTCNTCDKKFKTKRQLNQHQRVHVNDTPFKCNVCSKSYKYNTNLLLHMKKHDGYFCKFCKKDFLKLSNLLKHRKDCKLTRQNEMVNIIRD